MPPRIIHLLIVSFLSLFASAQLYSTAVFGKGPLRPSNSRATLNSSSRRIKSTHQSSSEIRLNPGETREQQISRDEVQEFLMELGAGQYAEVAFEWFGLNLKVAVLDSDGKKSSSADPILTANGPLSISILADKAGIYRLQVTPLVSQKVRGKYQVRLNEARLPTAEDRTRLEAQDQINQAQSAAPSLKFEKYGKAISLLEHVLDTNGAARALMLLGDAYREARDYPNARASYEHAAAIWKLNGYHRGEGYGQISLGALDRSSGSLNAALEHYKQAAVLFAQVGDMRGEADAIYGESFTLMMMDEPILAIPSLERVIQLRESYGDFLGEASALNMKADAHRIIGEIDKSFELYDRATKKLAGLEYRSLEASIAVNKALIDHDQGFWERARDEYLRALRLFESALEQPIPDACSRVSSSRNASVCRSAAAAIDNLGQVHAALSQFEEALEQLSEALAIWKALDLKLYQGLTEVHIGYAYFQQGRPDEAVNHYQTALTLLKSTEHKAGIALAKTYLGLIYTARNEPEKALVYYLEALPAQRATGNRLALAITLDNLGATYQLTGNGREAMACLAEALTLWRAIKDPDGEALTLYHQAIAEAAAGDAIAANRSSEAALRLLESLRTRLRDDQTKIAYLATRQDYYKLDIDLKIRLSGSDNGERYVAAAFESNEKGRARALLDSLAEADIGRVAIGENSDPQLVKLNEQRTALLERLSAKARARANLLSGKYKQEQADLLDAEIDDLNASYDELTTRIKSQNPRFLTLTHAQPSTSKEIQRQLDADTMLLEYSLGDKRSYVWAVTQDSIQSFELRGRKEIEEAATRFTRALTERNRRVTNETTSQWQRRIDQADTDSDRAAADLAAMVLTPVASVLGNKRLVIVADGALQFVSFGALPRPTNTSQSNTRSDLQPKTSVDITRFLSTDHEIVYEPSASVLALQRRELGNRAPAPYAVAVLANPVFEKDDPRVGKAIARTNGLQNGATETNESIAASHKPPAPTKNSPTGLTRTLEDMGINRFSALLYSGAEAEAIIKAAGPDRSFTAMNFQANRATAMSPELAKYRIIHFATHSIADFAHPELSGIVLSLVDENGHAQDGYLRLRDIYNLNLPADLVVLSACQTGVGKQIRGEGLIALTRGFMYAGAQRVVASLWKVDDSATADLMAEFYDQMFAKKLPPAAALRAAQTKLSHQPGRREPYYWAGFVLQGEWK